jgi:hypothetical protein
MSLVNLDQLHAAIDAAVPQRGGPPKVTAPALNAVLHGLAAGLPSAAPRRYEEVLHFPGQALFQDTVFEPSLLCALTASAGVARVELAVGAADFVELLASPATAAALPQPLALPVGPLTYRLTFAAGVSYAALKQIIQIQEII